MTGFNAGLSCVDRIRSVKVVHSQSNRHFILGPDYYTTRGKTRHFLLFIDTDGLKPLLLEVVGLISTELSV